VRMILSRNLAELGYDVRAAADGAEAFALLREDLALILVDWNMPHMNGLELCRHVRAKSPLPIIVLSVKGEEKIKVDALDAGADDYVTKPFSVNELLARVRAALRRVATGQQPASEVIELGSFRIDPQLRSVQVGGREVHLTPKEFELLVYLARHSGKVITHRVLLAAIWGENSVEQPEYLRVFVGHLRKKLEPEEHAPRYILTEPWVGYRFDPGE